MALLFLPHAVYWDHHTIAAAAIELLAHTARTSVAAVDLTAPFTPGLRSRHHRSLFGRRRRRRALLANLSSASVAYRGAGTPARAPAAARASAAPWMDSRFILRSRIKSHLSLYFSP
jgi:hypothetical protein